MYEMTDKEKLGKLEETFELEAGTLKPTDVLEKLSCWDSMAALSLIVLMSDDFNKKLTSAVLNTFVTVQDILNYMG